MFNNRKIDHFSSKRPFQVSHVLVPQILKKIIETFKVAIGILLIIYLISLCYNCYNDAQPKPRVNDETHGPNLEGVVVEPSQPVTIHPFDRLILYCGNCCNMRKPKTGVNAETQEPNLDEVVVDQESELHGPALWAILEAVNPIIADREAVVQPSQPAIIPNTESSLDKNQEINDLPTFDEARAKRRPVNLWLHC